MMAVARRITQKLEQSFRPTHLSVLNEARFLLYVQDGPLIG